MKISALASGSSGNCFYISNNNSSILVDAGISCKQILERIYSLKENPENLKAIFITHEHADHTKGADVLARKLNIPIFATHGTIQNSFLCQDQNLICKIKNSETLKIAGMNIQAFSKSHDCSDPISFNIKTNKTLSIITDIGKSCKNVIDFVEDSDFLIMESNHDLKMLDNGPYPYFLKQRISGDQGHISNWHSALCVLENAKSKLQNLILAHLSENNNTPEQALKTFQTILKERSDLKPKITISQRQSPTSLFKI